MEPPTPYNTIPPSVPKQDPISRIVKTRILLCVTFVGQDPPSLRIAVVVLCVLPDIMQRKLQLNVYHVREGRTLMPRVQRAWMIAFCVVPGPRPMCSEHLTLLGVLPAQRVSILILVSCSIHC